MEINPRYRILQQVMPKLKELRALVEADDKVGAMAFFDEFGVPETPTKEQLIAEAEAKLVAAASAAGNAQAELNRLAAL